ncbi:hypothetical protein [Nocardia donostiensis]|nr:hypothetical protein [Nocardia donostiensis]
MQLLPTVETNKRVRDRRGRSGAAGSNAASTLGRDRWTGRTSVPAIRAAGNGTDKRAQTVTTTGVGEAAAFFITHDLAHEATQHDVERYRAAAAR